MQLPNELIRILGTDIPVFFDDDEQKWGRRGSADFEDPNIVLNTKLAAPYVKKTFLHEVLEHITRELPTDVKHEDIVSIENGLWQFIQDNKEWVLWMLDSGSTEKSKRGSRTSKAR